MSKTTDPGHGAVTDWILTWSGRKVGCAGGEGVPSVEDIAVQAGRIPRFAGATRVWWSLLHHLHLVDRMVGLYFEYTHEGEEPTRQQRAWARLDALLHDAHEVCTGDIPGPFKPRDISSFQAELDVRLREDLGIPDPPEWVEALTLRLDRQALAAEGRTIGPKFGPHEDWTGFVELEGWALSAVDETYLKYPAPEDTVSHHGRAVRDYKDKVKQLIREVA